MLKRLGSPYEPGKRAASWIKLKKDYCEVRHLFLIYEPIQQSQCAQAAKIALIDEVSFLAGNPLRVLECVLQPKMRAPRPVSARRTCPSHWTLW